MQQMELVCSNVELEPSSEVDFIVPEKDQCEKCSVGVRKSLGYKRRRLYESSGLVLEPYRKRPKMLSYLLYPEETSCPSIFPEDMLWIMSLKFMPQTTPMWDG